MENAIKTTILELINRRGWSGLPKGVTILIFADKFIRGGEYAYLIQAARDVLGEEIGFIAAIAKFDLSRN